MEIKYVRIYSTIKIFVHFQSFPTLFTIPTKHIGNTKEIPENAKEIGQFKKNYIKDIKMKF